MEFNSGISFDDRGSVIYHNGFNPYELVIKRFYIVENFDANMVRAWHGHKEEDKWVTCIAGAAVIGYVGKLEICYGEMSGIECDIQKFTLNAHKPEFVFLPKGGYNGAMSLLGGTKLMYFSTATLEESLTDDFRLSWDYFGEEVWRVEKR